MKYIIHLIIFSFVFPVIVAGQTTFRSGIFLHHSTGAYIWGPNPDGTSLTTIPEQMEMFNMFYDLSGDSAVTMAEEWWAPDDNEWSTQHAFFEGNTAYTDIQHYLDNYRIIVVKSCFPSSAVEAWGQASDTLDPAYKSVYNYKWHWRHIVRVMEAHPEHFFVLWTNAPLEPSSTNASEAALAKQFCTWAKDTLAEGLDPEYGAFPPNVYVFDYFNKTTDNQGFELSWYVTAPGDSHPNGMATNAIAPQFVNEIFWAALGYEAIFNGIPEDPEAAAVRCYPNPGRDLFTFEISHHGPGKMSLSVCNMLGVEILQRDVQIPDGQSFLTVLLPGESAGVFLYRIRLNERVIHGRMVRR